MKHMGMRLVCGFVVLCTSLVTAQVAVTTYQNDSYRSGANTHETVLTPSNVNVSRFGRKTVFSVQGYVYAQPLYVPNVVIGGTSHNLVLVATEHDQVYAFDVATGQQIWHTNFLRNVSPLLVISAVSSSDVNCSDLVPEIGITGTPAIDVSSNTMYLVAKTKQYNVRTRTTTFFQTLHALDLRTGVDRLIPRIITGTAAGTGTGSRGGILTFDPLVEAQRASLLVQNGQIFVAWASHCDVGTYHGWLMSFNQGNMSPTGIFVDTPNGYEGGYWGGGSGPAADSAGSLYLGTGNGRFDANSGGTDYGDSVIRLSWSSSGFALTDYFSPWDEQTLDNNDTDLGAGGVTLLPDQPGSTYPHLLMQVGKEGTIDLINRDNMGHFHAGDDSQIVQTLPYAVGGVWGSNAFWNNNAFFSGANDRLKAFAFDPQAQKFSTGSTSQSPEVFGYPGPTPAVSSHGTSNGIVWLIQADSWQSGGNSILHAYDATNLAAELYTSEQNSARDRAGLALKFTVPTIADGHVFVGVENAVDMYGLLQ